MTDQTNTNASGFDLRQDGQASATTGQTADPATAATSAMTTQATTAVATATTDESLFEKYNIPDTVKEKFGELVPMILQTESMNDDERRYWFQILPIMTDDQVQKLREILVNEKDQLAALDKEYNQNVETINEKHVEEWKEFEDKEKREKIRIEEATTREQDSAAQEDLLGKLNNI